MTPRRRRSGQSLVEFALVMPIFTLFILTIIQLGFVAISYFSEAYMTLITARWLAINPDATDAELTARINATLVPGTIGGTPAQTQAGSSSLPSIWTVGRFTVTYTPCTPVSGVCTHVDRAPGEILFVEMTYNMSNLMFLPAQFRIGLYTINLPTTLPAYRVYAMSE